MYRYIPFLAMVPAVGASAQGGAGPVVVLEETFSEGQLDDAVWVHTVANDFETESVDVTDGRLRMAAATVGTNDRTVKFHGVRTAQPVVDLAEAIAVSFDLDWNDQANGCYMTAGVYICPTVAENPREEPDWLRIQYIGVPPGKNARCLISVKTSGHERHLFKENWPQDRTGRRIGLQRIEMVFDQTGLTVDENSKRVLQADDLNLPFDTAYVYLQHSSHSNYRLREVFFDNVQIHQ